MNVPEYHVAITLELHRMGGGWEEHELAWPVEKRNIGFSFPKDQLMNMGGVVQSASNVVAMGLQSVGYAEAKRTGMVVQKSGLQA